MRKTVSRRLSSAHSRPESTSLDIPPVTAVDITVVSDGSTDRTVELALRYSDRIHCIIFEQNPRLRRRHQAGMA